MTTAKVFDSVYSSMDRAVVHSSTFSKNQLAMVAGLATLQVLDDEDIVGRAARSGERMMAALRPLVEKYDLLREVRGMGLMIGLAFAAPESGASRARYLLMELARKGLFSQLIVVPLFRRHRILTQVAADNINVVKLLPPGPAWPATACAAAAGTRRWPPPEARWRHDLWGRCDGGGRGPGAGHRGSRVHRFLAGAGAAPARRARGGHARAGG